MSVTDFYDELCVSHVSLGQPVTQRVSHDFGVGLDAELGQNPRAVGADGVVAQAQLVGDLPARSCPAPSRRQHLELAVRQLLVQRLASVLRRARRRDARPLPASDSAVLERRARTALTSSSAAQDPSSDIRTRRREAPARRTARRDARSAPAPAGAAAPVLSCRSTSSPLRPGSVDVEQHDVAGLLAQHVEQSTARCRLLESARGRGCSG